MALGKPCVCTDVGGIPDIIANNETGILIKSGDPNSAADSLIQLFQDPVLRNRLGTAAQKLVLSRYNLDCLVDRVKMMYADSLIGNLKDEYGV
jgi:glycosyltransferase involved in cell wall biosynthesis